MPLAHYPHPTAALQQAYNRVSEMFLVSYPVRDLPLNIRPVRRTTLCRMRNEDELTSGCT
jgi:hypothetical protein